jgi:coenzyme F420-0:L-glutamate ligase
MKLYGVKTKTIEVGDNLAKTTIQVLEENGLKLENGDVLAFSSKIIAVAEGRIMKLKDVKPSEEAKRLSKQFSLQPEFAELVLRETDRVCGGVEKAILTLTEGILAPNAGIDNKNAPEGYVVLWPSDSEKSAETIWEELKRQTGKCVAVLIVDSSLAPMRIGTTGLALAVAGFKPVNDTRGKKDIYGKPLLITRHAVADDLASAAHLLMGEAAERTPIVLIKNAPIEFDDQVYGTRDMRMSARECIFMNAYDHLIEASEETQK